MNGCGDLLKGLSESNTPHHILETRVVTQVIPFWIDFEKRHFRISLFQSTFQPLEGRAVLLQRDPCGSMFCVETRGGGDR